MHCQDVKEEYTLLLKKKFFFYDAEVDTSDPATLNLIYEQYKNDVADGSLPVSRDDTVMLVALTCQVVLGDHDPHKHKPKKTAGMQTWIPEEYRKVSDLSQACCVC